MFADVGHSTFVAYLRRAMAARLVHFGLGDLDAGELRQRAPRAFTQEISRHIFECGRVPGGEAVVGIRYRSRLGDDLVNWALFEGNAPESTISEDLAEDDPDLVAVLALYGLALTPGP